MTCICYNRGQAILNGYPCLQRLLRTPAWVCASRGKRKGPYSMQDSLNDLTGGFLLQLPHYTVASQLTLHSKLQHKQSVELSSSQEVTLKSAIQGNTTNSVSSCLLPSQAKCDVMKKAPWKIFSKLQLSGNYNR